MFKRFFFFFARSPIIGALTGRIFAHCSFLLPLRRLYESERVLAFEHPWPSYPVHILLVPKKAISGIGDIQASDAGLLLEILQAGHTLARQVNPDTETGYQLVLNAGAYQDVAQLHVHLVVDDQSLHQREQRTLKS